MKYVYVCFDYDCVAGIYRTPKEAFATPFGGIVEKWTVGKNSKYVTTMMPPKPKKGRKK